MIGAIGHGVGHINDIDDSSAFHRAAALIVDLLLCNGFVFTERKGMILREVGACDGGGLGDDLGVQALELARMMLNGARMGGNLGGVLLVLRDTQFERVSFANAIGVSGHGSGACVHG